MSNAVIVLNTAVNGANSMLALEFAELCAEWIAKHGGADVQAKLLFTVDSEEKLASAQNFLNMLLPAFKKRGIKAEAVVKHSELDNLVNDIASLEPDVIFLYQSKLSKRIKEEMNVQKIEFQNPRKKELKMSMIYGAGAFLLYAGIFTSFEAIKRVLMHKGAVSVVMVLGTVLAVAYLYGNTVSHILRYLGLKPKAH